MFRRFLGGGVTARGSKGRIIRRERPKDKAPGKGQRVFNFERHKKIPWLAKSQYEKIGEDKYGRAIYRAPWGREYTDHAVDGTTPSQQRFTTEKPKGNLSIKVRSVSTNIVERTIAYGDVTYDEQGNKTYMLGDVRVGATVDDSKVYHVSYRHEIK